MLDSRDKRFGIWSFKTSAFILRERTNRMLTFFHRDQAVNRILALNLDGRHEARIIESQHLPEEDYVHPAFEMKYH